MLKPHGFVISIPYVRDCFRFFSTIRLRHRRNSAFGRIEPKKAPYEITGKSVEAQDLIALKLNIYLHFKPLITFLARRLCEEIRASFDPKKLMQLLHYCDFSSGISMSKLCQTYACLFHLFL